MGFNRSEEYNKTDHCIGTKNEGCEVSTTLPGKGIVTSEYTIDMNYEY